MSRALVLGGGGPVGIGWEAGFLSGLADAGVSLRDADLVFLSGVEWPETFRCTAFGLDSGQFALWDRAAGVEVHRAVASSCSVPGLSPSVTIAGERYIDGGARDMLNADLAVGHDRVVAVSCLVVDPPDGVVPDLLAGLLPDVRARIDELRSTGSTSSWSNRVTRSAS
jgi:NTE family protein